MLKPTTKSTHLGFATRRRLWEFIGLLAATVGAFVWVVLSIRWLIVA